MNLRSFYLLSELPIKGFTLMVKRKQERNVSAKQVVVAKGRWIRSNRIVVCLAYQKDYPLQELLGEVFGLSQGRANEWIHRLLPILKQALDDLGVLPERDPNELAQHEQDRADAADLIIDGTKDVVSGPKRPRNRHFTTAARRKPTVTRMFW